MFRLILGAFIFLPLFLSEVSSAQVIANVGGKEITLKEFNKRYEEVKKQTINAPSPSVFLEDLIRYEIGVQEAQKRKMDQDPIVKERLRQEMYKALLEKELGKAIEKIKVSEKEMKAYYKKNPEIRTSHILIEVKPNANQKELAIAEKRAKEILAKVKKSKRPFEELVKLYTDDTLSKNTGGDIGYQSRVTLVPPYYEKALNMKIGEVDGLVRSRYGFHIIKVTGRRAFNDADKRRIRAAVFDQKRKAIFDRYFAKIKKDYDIKINKSVLNKAAK